MRGYGVSTTMWHIVKNDHHIRKKNSLSPKAATEDWSDVSMGSSADSFQHQPSTQEAEAELEGGVLGSLP